MTVQSSMESITSEVKKYYENNYKQGCYFHREEYTDPNGDFLRPVTPLFDKFFGPRVLSILIISENYGYDQDGNFNWPDLSASKNKIKSCFELWSKYEVWFYLDFYTINLVEDENPGYFDQMINVESEIITLCEEMKDFGFVYKGKLETKPEPNFFTQLIDDWYKT